MKYLYNERLSVPQYVMYKTLKDVRDNIKILKDKIKLAQDAVIVLKKLGMPRYGIIDEVVEYKKDVESWLSDEEKALKWFTDNKITDWKDFK